MDAAPIGSRRVALEVSVSEPIGAIGALGVARLMGLRFQGFILGFNIGQG